MIVETLTCVALAGDVEARDYEFYLPDQRAAVTADGPYRSGSTAPWEPTHALLDRTDFGDRAQVTFYQST